MSIKITKDKNIFVKLTLKIGQGKYLLSVLKTNCWTYKIKDLNGEK